MAIARFQNPFIASTLQELRGLWPRLVDKLDIPVGFGIPGTAAEFDRLLADWRQGGDRRSSSLDPNVVKFRGLLLLVEETNGGSRTTS